MKALQVFVRHHPVVTYFLVTFTISWSGALLAIGGAGGMSGTAPTNDPRFVYAVLAMLAGPSIAGILLTAFVEGKRGLRELGARVRAWRVGARWLAVVLLTAPLLLAATLFALAFASSNFLPGIFTSTDKAGADARESHRQRAGPRSCGDFRHRPADLLLRPGHRRVGRRCGHWRPHRLVCFATAEARHAAGRVALDKSTLRHIDCSTAGAQTASFAAGLGNVERVDVLPFHQIGRYKWHKLNIEYTLEDVEPPTVEAIERACTIFRDAGLKTY
jgi:hypothetical protein